MNEWNLSDKVYTGYYHKNESENVCLTKDVREFIKRLKDIALVETEPNEYGFHIMKIPIEVLDKLAGEKLI